MKIGQTPELPGGLQPPAVAKQAKAPASAAEGATKDALVAPSAGVPVTVSIATRSLESASRSTADFDAGKVKAVRAAIDKGQFSVNAEAIADKLLSNAQEILSRSRG